MLIPLPSGCQPDVASAVDLYVCRRASLYAGNMFSAFSYLLREAKLVAGEAERSLYYNMEAGAARSKRPSGWAAPYLAVTGS